MEAISTTKLARKFSMSNRELEAKLRKFGIEPLQSVEISGRKFATWDREAAETKLRERRAAGLNNVAPICEDLAEIKKTLRKIESLLEKDAETA